MARHALAWLLALVLPLLVPAAPLGAQADTLRADSARASGAAASASAADDSAAAREAERLERRMRRAREAPLFASDTALPIVLVADFRALGGDRDTLRPVRRPGTLHVIGDGGTLVRVPVSVSARGNFRLRRCDFPPLRVTFDSGARGTPFAGEQHLKLVTHCRRTRDAEQNVLREHAAYRVHNVVTPLSYRTRLARIRYLDARDAARGDTSDVLERWGFFIERDGALAARLGGTELTARGGAFEDAGPDAGVSLALWEYFLGNTDWSVHVLHNIRLVAAGERGTLAVPYDFDFSGLVNTGYATPDPRLPIRSVRERLWRGPCADAALVTAALAPYVEHRARIEAVYRGAVPGLEARYAREALAYIEQFYDAVRDPARFARDVTRGPSCAHGG